MAPLLEVLQTRTWRELKATTLAHGLRFDVHQTKQQACHHLHEALAGGQLARAVRNLQPYELEALHAVQAAEGTLPLYVFWRRFGEIRPYKPWRTPPSALPEDQGGDWPAAYDPHPWRRPVSVAEKLWFLGLVVIVDDDAEYYRRVALPDEVLDLLPPLPRPDPVGPHLCQTSFGLSLSQGERDFNMRVNTPLPVGEGQAEPVHSTASSAGVRAVLHDLAALLGLLLREGARPTWGRWLPPGFLKAWGAVQAAPEDVADTRSELQTGRPRFLHYLAEAAGLVAVQGGLLLPTPAAWRWLNAPPEQQWMILVEALEADLAASGRDDERLWQRYRLPEVSAECWSALLRILSGCGVDQPYSSASLLQAVAPFVPAEALTGEGVAALLAGPLAWLGLVRVRGDNFALIEEGALLLNGRGWAAFPAAGDARIEQTYHALYVVLPDVPRIRPLAEVLSFVEVEPDGALRIDGAAVVRAVEQGYDAAGVAGILAALCGSRLPVDVSDRIETWAAAAQRLSLRQMTVLTSPDAATLAEIRADWRLRPLLGEPLSPHHLQVRADSVDELRRKLDRRGHPAASHLPRGDDGAGPSPLTPEAAEYLWLAAKVYQQLGKVVPLESRLPGEILRWLSEQMPEGRVDALAESAGAVIESVKRAVAGHDALPGVVENDTPESIRAAIEAAYESGGAVTIEYHSPTYGRSTRTIEPVLLYESGGAEYVEAWCQLDGATRTFRMDRVVGVGRNGP